MLRIFKSSRGSKKNSYKRIKELSLSTVGITSWNKFLSLLGVSPFFTSTEFNAVIKKNDEIEKIFSTVRKKSLLKVDSEEEYKNFIKKFRLYRGIRLLASLPLHGQRTHTNSKTARRLNK